VVLDPSCSTPLRARRPSNSPVSRPPDGRLEAGAFLAGCRDGHAVPHLPAPAKHTPFLCASDCKFILLTKGPQRLDRLNSKLKLWKIGQSKGPTLVQWGLLQRNRRVKEKKNEEEKEKEGEEKKGERGEEKNKKGGGREGERGGGELQDRK